MNSIFFSRRRVRRSAHPWFGAIAVTRAVLIVAFFLFAFAAWLCAQRSADAGAEFKRISSELSAARLSGAEENAAQMETALAYLDSVALSILAMNGPATPDLERGNQRLAGLVSHTPPVGENYRLVKLGGSSPVYAMVINFGLGGPAAVRIYASAGGQFALAAKIDHTVEKDFLDSDIELVAVSRSEPIFVTVAGRTDDLSTGMFSAWRFDGHRAVAIWTSDLLQQSTYEADDDGFHLAYCSQVDEDHPSQCLKMSKDLYRLQNGEWKRIESIDLPPPSDSPKK
jgi:hypothetical protein